MHQQGAITGAKGTRFENSAARAGTDHAQAASALGLLMRWMKKSDSVAEVDFDKMRNAAVEIIDSPEADPRSKTTAIKCIAFLHSKAIDVAMHLDNKERASKQEVNGSIKLYAQVEGFDTSKIGA